ncbi:Tumor suppressor p53-binding protein 1 [Heterocephalus glaber]|uniref:Tumor suppressor p53-binding protein 1 n=1 Tax=Heterocephalus glaber TaxID=10181 RepID=G5C220_HETGA|nr:Tumor suppressor p53-binding protein 1 [Heterocephalus glaber]
MSLESVPAIGEEKEEKEKEEVEDDTSCDTTYYLSAKDPASSQLGFGVLQLSQCHDVEEHIAPYEVDKEYLQLITTNFGYTRIPGVAADTEIKPEEQCCEDIPMTGEHSKDVSMTPKFSKVV